MTLLVTRIAPTPSGYLHIGNAVNFVLAWWRARAASGRLILRIDDFDTGRARSEYLDDIFATVQWLGIDVDEGPSGTAAFRSGWSMAARADRFRSALAAVRSAHPSVAFVCRCSRRELSDEGRCVRGCPTAGHDLEVGRSAVRLRVPTGTTARIAGATLPVPVADHVLWRRDDLPAYHLGSVVADVDLGVNALVRGNDLAPSTALQVHLAPLLDEPTFAHADFRHHGLIPAPDGGKLSKSAGSQAHPMVRDRATLDVVLAWAQRLGEPIGIGRP